MVRQPSWNLDRIQRPILRHGNISLPENWDYGGITVTYVDGPFCARILSGFGVDCVQSYVRPVERGTFDRWP